MDYLKFEFAATVFKLYLLPVAKFRLKNYPKLPKSSQMKMWSMSNYAKKVTKGYKRLQRMVSSFKF